MWTLSYRLRVIWEELVPCLVHFGKVGHGCQENVALHNSVKARPGSLQDMAEICQCLACAVSDGALDKLHRLWIKSNVAAAIYHAIVGDGL